MPGQLRVVLDTNVILRGMISRGSVAGQVLDAAEDRRVIVLLSRSVLAEYRAILTDPAIDQRWPALTSRMVDVTLTRLRYVGNYIARPDVRFEYARDPLDARFVELAIAGDATHIVSFDKDLLSLPTGRTEASKRFRQRLRAVQVVRPDALLWALREK